MGFHTRVRHGASALLALLGLHPAADASTIAQAEALGDNMAATVNNVVVSSVVDMINSTGFKTFHVQDPSGGVTVFGANALIDGILNGVDGMPGTSDDLIPGTRLDLSGTTDFFNGLFELADAPAVQPLVVAANLGNGPAPTPIDILAPDLLDGSTTAEFLESQLTRLLNVTFISTGIFAPNTNYTAQDQHGNIVTIRIASPAIQLVGDPIPIDPVNIVGIVTQFDLTVPLDGGYQLLPRFDSDITMIPEPSSVGLLNAVGLTLLRRRR